MSEIYKKEKTEGKPTVFLVQENPYISVLSAADYGEIVVLFESGQQIMFSPQPAIRKLKSCLLYTSPSPRDKRQSRMPSSA